MIFYHRTTEENWLKIKKEGILWGIGKSYRYTYLSPDDMGDSYGDVLLEVEYNPVGIDGSATDNYVFDYQISEKNINNGEYCWQFSVFVPIDIKYVKRIL